MNEDAYIIFGGEPLKGQVELSGSKNLALKILVASLLTEKELVIENVPLIADVLLLSKILKKLGVKIQIRKKNIFYIKADKLQNYKIPLEMGAKLRVSSMILAPLLLKVGKGIIPNPGGCRIGARPIDRFIKGLTKAGATIKYDSKDGYFYAQAKKLSGLSYIFPKNTHTGTESLILAASLAKGKTVLENAAQEPEVDELIRFLNQMGAQIRRSKPRTIVIEGVQKLSGTKFRIMPDRNEAVTFAVAAYMTDGDILVKGSQREYLRPFLAKLDEIGASWEPKAEGTRFFGSGSFKPTKIETKPYPHFMTDWQAPFALLLTQAEGISTIHETVYENRFQYFSELKKMGAKFEFFNPKVKNPDQIYNFNLSDDRRGYYHGVRIFGPTSLHNAYLSISDLRAGATLVLAALSAQGQSYLSGVCHIDRGYERFEERLKNLGAKIKRIGTPRGCLQGDTPEVKVKGGESNNL